MCREPALREAVRSRGRPGASAARSRQRHFLNFDLGPGVGGRGWGSLGEAQVRGRGLVSRVASQIQSALSASSGAEQRDFVDEVTCERGLGSGEDSSV